jgi:hypothetical protein
MFGEKALELIKELHRARTGTLPPFNVLYNILREIILTYCNRVGTVTWFCMCDLTRATPVYLI